MVEPRKIAILGAGRIGEALIAGLLSSGWREPGEIAATARRQERVDELRERHGVDATTSNHDAAAGAALVVISVKPQDIDVLLGEIGGLILPEQTVLTIAAAVSTAKVERRLSSGVPVVRACGEPVPTRESIGRLSPARLCACGLAASRASTLTRLSRTIDLEALRTAPPERSLAVLGRERGIGPWSIGVIALQGLGRFDVGLVADLGLVKLLAALRGRWPAPEETAELLEPYEEWQGLASVFLLAGFTRGLVPGASSDRARQVRASAGQAA